MVFVARPPTATPTGRYLGCVPLQRLLCEAPAELVGGIVDSDLLTLKPETPLAAVTRYLAAYNLVCGPVVDDQNSPVGSGNRRRPSRSLAAARPASRRAKTRRCRPAGRVGRTRVSKSTAPRRLYTPRTSRRYSPRLDPEAVGQVTESIARFFGTGRYLLVQTIVVVVRIGVNLFAAEARFDPYPLILLNLAFSTQAAYAAPLILLAQNRQENRDRVALEQDRHRAAQTKADTEYLAPRARCAAASRRRGCDLRIFAARTGRSARAADQSELPKRRGRGGTGR